MEVLSSRVLLRTADLAVSRRFYEGRLGLRVYREYGTGGTVSGVVLFLGGGFLELTSGGSGSAAGEGGPGARSGPVLWLQVPDLAAEHDRLVAGGVEIVEPPRRMPWGLDEAWIADPDGLEIVLVEVPPAHPLRRRV